MIFKNYYFNYITISIWIIGAYELLCARENDERERGKDGIRKRLSKRQDGGIEKGR